MKKDRTHNIRDAIQGLSTFVLMDEKYTFSFTTKGNKCILKAEHRDSSLITVTHEFIYDDEFETICRGCGYKVRDAKSLVRSLKEGIRFML